MPERPQVEHQPEPEETGTAEKSGSTYGSPVTSLRPDLPGVFGEQIVEQFIADYRMKKKPHFRFTVIITK